MTILDIISAVIALAAIILTLYFECGNKKFRDEYSKKLAVLQIEHEESEKADRLSAKLVIQLMPRTDANIRAVLTNEGPHRADGITLNPPKGVLLIPPDGYSGISLQPSQSFDIVLQDYRHSHAPIHLECRFSDGSGSRTEQITLQGF